jgi:TonB family protein
MKALMYQSSHHRRFAAAFGAAVIIHVAAIGFATTKQQIPIVSGPPGEPPVLELLPPDPIANPQPEQSDPLSTPPTINDFPVENATTTTPVHRRSATFTPVVKRSNNRGASSLNLSAARVFAINAPRPEYPYEARRQKITGDGVVAMTVDPASGQVTDVFVVKSTGSPFLDNAALAGFRRWRFKPGTASSIRCPITFTLTGASY